MRAYESDKSPRSDCQARNFQISNERSSQNVRPMQRLGDLLSKIDNMTRKMDSLSTGFTKLGKILNSARVGQSFHLP